MLLMMLLVMLEGTLMMLIALLVPDDSCSPPCLIAVQALVQGTLCRHGAPVKSSPADGRNQPMETAQCLSPAT